MPLLELWSRLVLNQVHGSKCPTPSILVSVAYMTFFTRCTIRGQFDMLQRAVTDVRRCKQTCHTKVSIIWTLNKVMETPSLSWWNLCCNHVKIRDNQLHVQGRNNCKVNDYVRIYRNSTCHNWANLMSPTA